MSHDVSVFLIFRYGVEGKHSSINVIFFLHGKDRTLYLILSVRYFAVKKKKKKTRFRWITFASSPGWTEEDSGIEVWISSVRIPWTLLPNQKAFVIGHFRIVKEQKNKGEVVCTKEIAKLIFQARLCCFVLAKFEGGLLLRHLISKWPPFKSSFVCVQISPCCLVQGSISLGILRLRTR